MQVKDIIYDGQKFSDYGLLNVYVSLSEELTPDIGNKLELTKVKAADADVYHIVNAQYQDVVQFQIEATRINCEYINNYEMTGKEINDFLFWLNRKEPHKFQVIYDKDGFDDIYYMGTFTEFKPIKVGAALVGFNCTFTANAPFAFHEPVTFTNYKIKVDSTGKIVKDADGNIEHDRSKEFRYNSISTEEGFIYCDCTVKLFEDGDFTLTNEYDLNPVVVKNCKSGEILTFKGSNNVKNLTSSLGDAHKKLFNDFNFRFPRVMNVFGNPHNQFKSSLDAEITMTYIPIAKVGEIF